MTGKKIVLGITGSIAAYKACELTRLLVKSGNEVQVVMTSAGKDFVTPLTLATLSQHPVVSEFFDKRDGSWNSHVSLGLWADVMLIAPATASTISKMAHGVADNILVTTYLSMKAPVFVAPAMDLDMYAHETTAKNIGLLKSHGVRVIEPATGALASNLIGKGRMEEPEIIIQTLDKFFSIEENLKGKTILITAGPTQENIDPVRFISNHSSGKMGIALAEACARRDAEVRLICGPISITTSLKGISRIDVESAGQMYEAAIREFPSCDAAILCAAVADYTPVRTEDSKIKREGENIIFELKPTRDIAAALGQLKTDRQVIVGFALETNDEVENARKKLIYKNLDFIVLNSLRDKGAGFRYDTNKITIIDAMGMQTFPLKSKLAVAEDIINELCKCFGK